MFVSIAALVVAASGTSYAVATIGSADIRNGSILPVDIKDNRLKTNDIMDGGLLARDFREGQLPQGAQGVPGVQGPAGADGAGRWLLVDRNGAIVAQSGGFEIHTAYDIVNNSGAPVPAGALGNVYIESNEDLSNNGIVVSIALQNQFEQNNNANVNGRALGPDANPEFSGEITGSQCAVAGAVACAPAGANMPEYLVVSPRMSDGSVTQTGAIPADPANPNTHKRFYVIITGDSSDFVAPTN
ncbi:hypothetical protein NPS01_23120 [Nocardioides psychrotolerans]|nr:hypothetical protein NPS01_23120 [Nocardioides psychrotolerans]